MKGTGGVYARVGLLSGCHPNRVQVTPLVGYLEQDEENQRQSRSRQATLAAVAAEYRKTRPPGGRLEIFHEPYKAIQA